MLPPDEVRKFGLTAAGGVTLVACQPGFEALPVVTLGLSMGSTMTLWAAALDERIAGCIELCGAAEYDALLKRGLRGPRGVLLRPRPAA